MNNYNLINENRYLACQVDELKKEVERKGNIIMNILAIVSESNHEELRDKILASMNNKVV